MKLYRNAIILAAVLVVLIGTYFIVSNLKKGSDTSSTGTANNDALAIFKLDSDKINGIEVERKDGKLVFAKQDKEWKCTFPQDLQIDKDRVNSIAINISYLFAERIIEEKATDLGKYGLDNPSVIFTFKMTDGTSKTIELGDLTSTKGAYYAKLKGTDKVFTLDTYTVEKFNVGKFDVKSKTLFTITQDDIIGFTMERGGQLVFSSKKNENKDWVLTAPIEGNANLTNLTPIFDAVTKTVVMNYIDDNPTDLDKYGLKNPLYSMEIDTAKNKYKILLGTEKVKDTEIYAKLADRPEIFTIDMQPLNFLDRPLKEIIEVFAYIPNIEDVNKVEVQIDGQTIKCDIQTNKDDSDKDKFSFNGKEALMKDVKNSNDDSLFRQFYQSLVGITLDEIDINGKPAGNPEISITYFLKKSPGTMKVDFISKDDRYYYVVRNEKYSGITVLKSQFDKSNLTDGVRTAYKNLKEAMDKLK